jgi:hypothetical protein
MEDSKVCTKIWGLMVLMVCGAIFAAGAWSPASANGAFQPISGTGVVSLEAGMAGACPGMICAEGVVCECQTLTGMVRLKNGGNSSFFLELTMNDTDITTEGPDGACYPFFGNGLVSASKGSFTFVVTGMSSCQNWHVGDTGALDDSTFSIVEGLGTGAFADARGTGSMNWAKDFETQEALVNFSGTIQLSP